MQLVATARAGASTIVVSANYDDAVTRQPRVESKSGQPGKSQREDLRKQSLPSHAAAVQRPQVACDAPAAEKRHGGAHHDEEQRDEPPAVRHPTNEEYEEEKTVQDNRAEGIVDAVERDLVAKCRGAPIHAADCDAEHSVDRHAGRDAPNSNESRQQQTWDDESTQPAAV